MNQRPKGISIFAILNFIGGIIIVGLPLYVPFAGLEGLQAMDELGFPSSLLLIAFGFLGALSLAAGVGMWTGKKWGWWLGAFYLAYAILRNANALFAIEALTEQFGAPEDGTSDLYFKHGARVVTNSLVLFYFFRSHVVEFFGVDGMKSWKKFAILLAVTLAVGFVFSVIAVMMGLSI